MINISPMNVQAKFFEKDYIRQYAKENANNLNKVKSVHTQSKYIVVATVKGWVTCVSIDKGYILQGWSGEFIATL